MKDFFKFLGGSLFSNNNVLKGKKRKFYQSLIVVILSLIIAIIPVFVYTMRVNGSQAITKTDNSSLDVSLTLFSKYLYENEDVGLTRKAISSQPDLKKSVSPPEKSISSPSASSNRAKT